jgi:zinc D-Ala-D-Ala carboxypeptidase
MGRMQLSPNFSLSQLSYSETAEQNGIDNTPPPEIVPNLKRLAEGLEAVRAVLGAPLEISSGYRCAALNEAVGGSATSQHMLGLAVDFECPAFGTPLEIADAIRRSGLEFDQCILEYGRWVHLSFSDAPRRRLLTIYDDEKGYVAGLWDEQGKLIA